ncbi:MAG: nuclear transport factor 2 family protein [Croceibacterium sp.]
MTEPLSAHDQIAIRETLARCAWALDTGDVEGFVACFCSDGAMLWDVFEQPARWHGAAALRRFAEFFRAQPSSAGRQHHVTNTVITSDQERTTAMSYVTVALRQGDGPHWLNVMGYYEDSFRFERGEWRLAERIIRDWSGPVLARVAGQSGARAARPLPPQLAEAGFNGDNE